MASHQASDSEAVQEFLLQAATLLHRLGAPSHRLERVMARVAQSLRVTADFLYTPTALLVSFNSGVRRTVLKRVEPSEVDLGKLYEVDEALENLEDGKTTLAEASCRLQAIERQGPRYAAWQLMAAAGLVSACVTIFFGGGWGEVLFALGMGSAIQWWARTLRRIAPQENLLEVTAAFASAASALVLAACFPPFNDRLATLGSLITLVPGMTFTVGMTELANRHLSSGVARLAWSAVVLLALACGVLLAWRLGADWRPVLHALGSLPPLGFYLALLVAPVMLAVLYQARPSEWLVIVPVAWLGFAVSAACSAWKGSEFGAFAGALSIGVASNIYARWWDRPAMVPQTPAILMLVPGNLGFRSMTAFIDQEELLGLEFAFGMTMAAIALVGGLLVANLVVPPRRSL